MDLLSDFLLDENLNEVLEGVLVDSGSHNLGHLLSDELLVGSLGVAGSLNLLGGLLGEANGKNSENVSVVGLSLNEGLNGGVPFLHHGLGLISSDVHSVEVSVAVVSLNLINLELKLSEGSLLGGVVAISKGGLENSSSKVISSINKSGRFVARSKSNASLIESGDEDVVPLFFGEGMDSLLLGSLLLEVSWVLSGGHIYR